MDISPAIKTQLTTSLNHIAKHKLVVVQSHPVLMVPEVLLHESLVGLEVFVPPRIPQHRGPHVQQIRAKASVAPGVQEATRNCRSGRISERKYKVLSYH